MGRPSVSILVLCAVLVVAAVSFQAGRRAVASGLLSLPITLDPSSTSGVQNIDAASPEGGDGDLWLPPRGSLSQALSSGAAADTDHKFSELKRKGTFVMALPSDRVRENRGKSHDWLKAARAARQGSGQAEFELDPNSSSGSSSAAAAAATQHAPAVVVADQEGPGKAMNTNLDLFPKIRRVSVFDQVLLLSLPRASHPFSLTISHRIYKPRIRTRQPQPQPHTLP